MMLLYSVALSAVLTLSAPVWLLRMLRQGRYREGLRQRLGRVPPRLATLAKNKHVIWLHAVSVGEVLAATRLADELERALPDFVLVISTTTPTGQRVARERFGAERVFFFPLDFAFAVRAYLHLLKPQLLILMESELWPRMLTECARAGVPVAVVNARVSDRSFPRYMRLRALWRPLLWKVTLLLAQSEEDARRWRAIGAPPDCVQTTGNLKYDIAIDGETPLVQMLRTHLPPNTQVLVCGSTHDGEEAMLLDCWPALLAAQEHLVLILAPRHPQRCDAVTALLMQRGLPCIRLSAWRNAPKPVAPGSVLLVDTVGELSTLYSLASVAFVGGSLVPKGGHNPLEPAQFGVPVVTGPHHENFRAMVQDMRNDAAICITDADGLCLSLTATLANDSDLGARAAAFARSQGGATVRTVGALLTLLAERES